MARAGNKESQQICIAVARLAKRVVGAAADVPPRSEDGEARRKRHRRQTKHGCRLEKPSARPPGYHMHARTLAITEKRRRIKGRRLNKSSPRERLERGRQQRKKMRRTMTGRKWAPQGTKSIAAARLGKKADSSGAPAAATDDARR
ncbi:hypothetical protein MRX96_044202 [Rhipicephalus microplus]